MQVVSVHADVIVVRSAFWQTSCTIVHRAGADGAGECFVVDSPVLPHELEATCTQPRLPPIRRSHSVKCAGSGL